MGASKRIVQILEEAFKAAVVDAIVCDETETKGSSWIRITLKDSGPFFILCRALGINDNMRSKKGGILHIYVSHNPCQEQNRAYAKAFTKILNDHDITATVEDPESGSIPEEVKKQLKKKIQEAQEIHKRLGKIKDEDLEDFQEDECYEDTEEDDE